jgi:hemerythrin-like domain-containing protein
MNVFEILDHEHQLIGPALKVAQSCALRMGQPGAAADQLGQELIGFCDKFVSQCHQVKEFNLYVRLLQKGRSYVIAPIASLHAEHSRLAQLTESLDAAWRLATEGQPGAGELVAGYLTDYAALMEAHILKEERFYRVTDSILGYSDHVELKATFDRLDQAMLGADGHARYCQWVYQLAGAPC